MGRNASDSPEVWVTVSSRAEASRICPAVMEQRLAAAAQVIAPIESVYRWAGGSGPPVSGWWSW
ncbi:divalent cation tolerance protein CutA [Streptosporangium algeriense]|uniref:Divalent cation tolerance protein CutA n=1 Tax=Streptosporangium algeriense TaxID=1682748 RepID=A0ABW3DL20_9ACTN